MDELGFLETLLSIPSPSGAEGALAEYLTGQMSALGFRAHSDEVGNDVGMIGPPHAEREIVLLGHMDTVPGHIPVRAEGSRLYGRGAVDAKGPLAAFVLAAARVAPRLTGARVLVIGAVEEERQSLGARHLIRTVQPPTCTIIGEPSDWQAITLGYKGSLTVGYHLEQPAGHSAGAQPGVAEQAVTFWNRLVAHAEHHNNANLDHARSGRFHTLDPALRTFNTFTDGLKDGVNMNVTLRLPPGLHEPNLKRTMEMWSDGAELEFHPSDPAFRAEKNTPLVRAMLRAVRAEGGRPRFKLKTGTSDMNVVGPAWGCPVVAYGPGDSSLDHTPDEYIEIEEFRRAIEVLARALETLAN